MLSSTCAGEPKNLIQPFEVRIDAWRTSARIAQREHPSAVITVADRLTGRLLSCPTWVLSSARPADRNRGRLADSNPPLCCSGLPFANDPITFQADRLHPPLSACPSE